MSCRNKRFKGVENFLRRVAFNLGNTPSQTEVKIISCIPIDVTDLQQKIAELEKKLEETSREHRDASHPASPPTVPATPGSKPGSKRTSVVNTAAVCTPLSHKRADFQDSNVSIHFECHPNQKSALFIYDPKHCQNQDCAELFTTKLDKHKQHTHSQQQYQHLLRQSPRKNLFTKNKNRAKKKCGNKTELVYYAQHDDNTPFNSYEINSKTTTKTNGRCDELINETSYLSNVLWKQYMSRPALNHSSNTSEFSSPVCRDDPSCPTTLYESDICSCCREPFQNLDLHMKPNNRFNAFLTAQKENDNKYAYYDSNAYDVVPVKETNIKPDIAHKSTKPKKKHHKKSDVNMKCWPERVRTKRVTPFIINYHTISPIRNNFNTKPYKKYKKDFVLRAMSANRPATYNSSRNSDDTKVCYVDYSDVYSKRKIHPKRQKLMPVPQLNDASCLTTIFNNTDCQTTTESNDNPVEDKTTATLNQIKTILQSVLTEVKTNAKLGKSQEPKKDAVVQNGPSQSKICGGSELLQSLTYSPCNMSPFVASCSRQMPSSSFGPHGTPYGQSKCMHYPLFVQPNRHMCTCYKNTNIGKPTAGTFPKRAASISTNTDQQFRRSKETHKLIKDIYNSIALNIELPTRDTTNNQGDQGFNMTTNDLKTNPEEANNAQTLVSEIYKNLNPLNTSVTEKTTTTLDSKMTSNTNSVRSDFNNNNRTPVINKFKVDTSEGNTTGSEYIGRNVEEVSEEEESDDDDDDNDDTAEVKGDVVLDSSTVSEDEADQDETTIESDEPNAPQKRERKGLFSKMIKMFKSRNTRKPKETTKDGTEGDTDDYQTVYSQKPTLKPQIKLHKPVRRNKVIQPTYGKSNQSPERTVRRPPYLEQEYRRYWDERLLFQNKHEKHSTEESRITNPQVVRPYNRNYEARAFTVPNTRAIPSPTTYPVKRSSFATNRTTGNRSNAGNAGLAWLKQRKLNIQCGEQWKKLILEG